MNAALLIVMTVAGTGWAAWCGWAVNQVPKVGRGLLP